MSLTKSLLLLLRGPTKRSLNHCEAVLHWLQHSFKLHWLYASLFSSPKVALQAVLGGPRHSAYLAPPSSRSRVLSHFCSGSAKIRWVFAHFRKRKFWHPYIFLFLWFSLSLLRARRRGRIQGAHASPPTPFYSKGRRTHWNLSFQQCNLNCFRRVMLCALWPIGWPLTGVKSCVLVWVCVLVRVWVYD